MAILFLPVDDCRCPKIQFKKPEKMFFVSREAAKNWIIKKASKNKNIDQNNEKNIENNMIFLFFIIIFAFCKNNLQKCFKKIFLDVNGFSTNGCEIGSGAAADGVAQIGR